MSNNVIEVGEDLLWRVGSPWAFYERPKATVVTPDPSPVGSWYLFPGDDRTSFASYRRPSLFYRLTLRVLLGWRWVEDI